MISLKTFYKTLAVLAVAGALGIAALGRADRSELAGSLNPPPDSLGGIQVELVDGRVVPAAPPGGGVVMVVLSTCPHCRRSLERIAAEARGESLAGLLVIAGDGAPAGAKLLQEIGIDAMAAGPPEDPKLLFEALGVPAVPYFFAVDRAGRVLDTAIGELDGGAVERWVTAAQGR